MTSDKLNKIKTIIGETDPYENAIFCKSMMNELDSIDLLNYIYDELHIVPTYEHYMQSIHTRQHHIIKWMLEHVDMKNPNIKYTIMDEVCTRNDVDLANFVLENNYGNNVFDYDRVQSSDMHNLLIKHGIKLPPKITYLYPFIYGGLACFGVFFVSMLTFLYREKLGINTENEYYKYYNSLNLDTKAMGLQYYNPHSNSLLAFGGMIFCGYRYLKW